MADLEGGGRRKDEFRDRIKGELCYERPAVIRKALSDFDMAIPRGRDVLGKWRNSDAELLRAYNKAIEEYQADKMGRLSVTAKWSPAAREDTSLVKYEPIGEKPLPRVDPKSFEEEQAEREARMSRVQRAASPPTSPLASPKPTGSGRGLKLLELFKGTGSVGKQAHKLGMSVVSLDFDEGYKPDIVTDILEWDYKKYHADTGYVPDLIWASPPCNTFSPLAYPLKERNTQTAAPKSARARQGTAILYRTIEIIEYFLKLNPKLLYTMENPRGMMRKDKRVKKLPHQDTTAYCLYNDIRYKPTDFWNNVPATGLELKDVKDADRSKTVGVVELPLNKRYEIPSKLARVILETMKAKYGK